MKINTFQIIIFVIVGIILLIIGFFTLPKILAPTNNQVGCTMEAKICPDGSIVGRTGPNCEFAPCPKVKTNQSPCYIGGCSSEICSNQKDIISPCIYLKEFACYKTAKCERQTNGQCDWTQTTTLANCIKNNQ